MKSSNFNLEVSNSKNSGRKSENQREFISTLIHYIEQNQIVLIIFAHTKFI